MTWKGTSLSLLLFRLSKEGRIMSNLIFLFDKPEMQLRPNETLRLCILHRLTQCSYRHEIILDSCKRLSRYL